MRLKIGVMHHENLVYVRFSLTTSGMIKILSMGRADTQIFMKKQKT